MKRRNFIKLAGTASAIGLFPTELKAMLKAVDISNCGDLSNRKLVLINLVGGNDGLNTTIPLDNYDTYESLRPTLKIPKTGTNSYITLDNTLATNQQLGLHPSLTGFKSLYDKGVMRILQSVGYPSLNKSHFASKDIYSTGNDGNNWGNGNGSGWIGRFMEHYYSGQLQEDYPLGVQIGSNKTDLGFHGADEHGLAINISGQDPSGFYSELNGLSGQPPANIPNSHFGTELQYIINTDNLSNKYSQSISSAFNNGSNTITYPDTDLANQLKTVAKMISGGLQTKVYMVQIGGFDTHNNQSQANGDIQGKHNDLLTEVSTAIEAFVNDLTTQTLADDVVGLTYSEFGRKAKENGNLGTDHGEIAPMFVFGKPVNGGVSGTNVDLSEATSNNNYQLETVQFDYRQTLGTLLQDFLGASDLVIDSTFFNHTNNQSFTNSKISELLKSSHAVPQGCLENTLSINEENIINNNEGWSIFPNPFKETLFFYSEKEIHNARYKITNLSGKIIQQGGLTENNGVIQVTIKNLASGIYIIQVFSNETVESHKVFHL